MVRKCGTGNSRRLVGSRKRSCPRAKGRRSLLLEMLSFRKAGAYPSPLQRYWGPVIQRDVPRAARG